MALRHAVGWGLLFAVLAADASSLAAAMTGDAQSAYDSGQFEEARRIWVPLAEAGDAEAQFRLGLLFDLGQGVPKDLATAYMWYRRAAEAGLAQAQFNVAVMQDSGLVGLRNAVEAARWYRKAAAQGHHRAQYNLAQLYASGDGVLSNIAQAKAWYRVAAHGGLTAAANKLAEIERSARSGPSPSEPAPVVQAHLATPQLGLSAELPARLPAAASAPEQAVQVQSAQADETLGDDEPRTVRPATGVPPPLKNADFLWPVSGKVIGSFGPIDQWSRRNGIDIAARRGAPVLAAQDGIVAYAGDVIREYGQMILLRHDQGYITTYAHNAALLVGVGDVVRRGQVIARVGDSGDTNRSMLYFELRKGRTPIDPQTRLVHDATAMAITE
jgi:murein DD-endopeptidase MepM/ murein hydrolase activator NlpD